MNFNTTEEANEYIKGQLKDYLKPAKKKGYICPLCGNGTGTTGTGASFKDGLHIKCFKCGFYGDIFDLIQAENNTDKSEAGKIAYKIFNISISNDNTRQPQSHKADNAHIKDESQAKGIFSQIKDIPQTDFTEYYSQAHKTLKESPEAIQYLYNRGITAETINRFKLGYDPQWKSPNSPAMYQTARIIIPTNINGYTARAIDPKTDPKFKAMKTGKTSIFNLQALYNTDNEPVFITEGEIDTLSIIEAGGEAAALGSIAYKNKLIEQLKQQPTKSIIILSLDNDKAGEDTADSLESDFKALNIAYKRANISGKHKDPNEAFIADKIEFIRSVKEVIEQIKEEQQEAIQAEKEAYYKNNVYNHISDFIEELNTVNTPAIPTGFKELDNVLDGGLYEGLYIVGAISSLGKTTLILQIADQIAQQEQDVLIFSLEMARAELMAKSISRITFLECGGKIKNAKTTRGITAFQRWQNYSEEEATLINDSINKYASYAKSLYISEGLGNIGTTQINEAVEKHIYFTGKKPVVIIDYLQILAPADARSTDKQNTDKAVFDLKRISRDYKIPVIGISSLNRDSYTNKISMKAFKESGAIEYSSDILIGLQFQNNEDLSEDNIDKEKRRETRKIELKILKNRNGQTGAQINFNYIPMFNYFQETGTADPANNKNTAASKNKR